MMPRLSLFWQTFLAFGALIVLALGVLGGVLGNWVEQQALLQIEDLLKSKAILLREIVRGRDVSELRSQIATLHQRTATRITLIAPNGKVVAETDRDPDDLDDHGE